METSFDFCDHDFGVDGHCHCGGLRVVTQRDGQNYEVFLSPNEAKIYEDSGELPSTGWHRI
jgi:hypothetical protein